MSWDEALDRAAGRFAETVRPVGPAGAARGRIVRSCFDVAEADIGAEIARGADLPALQRALKCGTHCGSCVPELRRLCAERRSLAAAA